MAIDLSTLLTEFYAHGFDYLNDGAAGTTRAKRWINQAKGEINDLENWAYLETSTTGTPPLTISDLRNIESVVTTFGPLEELDRKTLAAQTNTVATAGTNALWYYRTGLTTVAVFPVTTEILTVNYWRNEAYLVNDADTTLIPDRFLDVVVWGAVRKALRDDADGPDARDAITEWDRGIEQMRRALLPTFSYQLLTDASTDS